MLTAFLVLLERKIRQHEYYVLGSTQGILCSFNTDCELSTTVGADGLEANDNTSFLLSKSSV